MYYRGLILSLIKIKSIDFEEFLSDQLLRTASFSFTYVWLGGGTRNSNTLATSCEELTYWKRLWCWEELGAGGEGDYRGWDGWMASRTWWTWVWVNSGSWWWTGRPSVLRFMGLQRVRHNWVTELNWCQTWPQMDHTTFSSLIVKCIFHCFSFQCFC